MLLGPSGSEKICSLGGSTIHRRTIRVRGLMMDLHFRLDDSKLCTSAFGCPAYLGRLGQALGDLHGRVFQDFVGTFMRICVGDDHLRILRTCIYYEFPDDLKLYQGLLESDLGQHLRVMMSKFYYSDDHS